MSKFDGTCGSCLYQSVGGRCTLSWKDRTVNNKYVLYEHPGHYPVERRAYILDQLSEDDRQALELGRLVIQAIKNGDSLTHPGILGLNNGALSSKYCKTDDCNQCWKEAIDALKQAMEGL